MVASGGLFYRIAGAPQGSKSSSVVTYYYFFALFFKKNLNFLSVD